MLKKPAVSASYLKIILDALASRGLDSASIKERAGITDAQVSETDGYIDTDQYQALITEALDTSGDSALGLYIGRSFEVGTHGILSYAALGMPTVWACLKLGEEFARIRSPILNVSLRLEKDEAVISFDTNAFSGRVYQFIIEGAICSYYSILNMVFENNVPSATINVRYASPKDPEHYISELGENVRFSCTKNEIRLPRSSVNKALHTANPVIARELEKHIHEQLQATQDESISDRVKFIVRHNSGSIPSQDTIAEKLNLSTRTLRRQLKEEGTSFQNLLNECRRDIAIDHLKNSDLNIEEIAYLLGFSSSSHFSHAFKQWTGSAPKFYRADTKTTVG